MQLLKKFFILIWRIWFYFLLGFPILVMFPLLLLSSSREKWYPYFFFFARIWATVILYGMGFIPQVKKGQKFEKDKSYMLVSNHTSMTDIMLMLYIMKKPFVFVGKKSLAKIPLFGFFYKRTCILVDRGNPKSKKAVFESAQKRIQDGTSICIFPEGGVPDDISIVLDTFKDGAFRLAVDHQIPIVPIIFHDNKNRFSYSFFTGSPGKMRVKIHPFISTEGKKQADKKVLRDEIREVIYNELMHPSV